MPFGDNYGDKEVRLVRRMQEVWETKQAWDAKMAADGLEPWDACIERTDFRGAVESMQEAFDEMVQTSLDRIGAQ